MYIIILEKVCKHLLSKQRARAQHELKMAYTRGVVCVIDYRHSPLRLLSEHTEHPNAVECSREINRASFQVVYDFRKYSGISSSDSSDAAVVGTVMVEVDSSVRGTGPAGSNWAPPLVDGSDEAEAATALGPPTELLTTLPEGTFKGVGEVFGVLVGSYSRLRQIKIASLSLAK